MSSGFFAEQNDIDTSILLFLNFVATLYVWKKLCTTKGSFCQNVPKHYWPEGRHMLKRCSNRPWDGFIEIQQQPSIYFIWITAITEQQASSLYWCTPFIRPDKLLFLSWSNNYNNVVVDNMTSTHATLENPIILWISFILKLSKINFNDICLLSKFNMWGTVSNFLQEWDCYVKHVHCIIWSHSDYYQMILYIKVWQLWCISIFVQVRLY